MDRPADPREAPLRLLDEVSWEGRSLAGERSQALLAALTLAGGRAVGDAALVEEVWGRDAPANPTKALQVLVSRTRSVTSADVVRRGERGYRLGLPSYADALLVGARARTAREAESRGDLAAARSAASTALVAVTPPTGDGPLDRLRAAARVDVAAARAVLGRSLTQLGEHAAALPVLTEAVLADPDDESLVVALLRSEAAERGAPAALERYERHRAALRDRLGTDPGQALQSLYAELLVRDRPVREGLEYDAAALIGRADDVAALAVLVRTSRVTSIVGAGGLGKTRLAHTMGRLAEQPVVHLVELAGVAAPEGVTPEVASALGVRESLASARLAGSVRRADLVSRIVEQVGPTPALLVLDNCEHLIEAVADLVAALVVRTPRLHVLTTSRAPLGLAAERVYLLPQLSVADAALLFRERATAARPGVRLEEVEVARLVARLDGLPLAVELAAAKVRVMAVAEIERRLEDRFALLRGGSRGAPERHQTLLAVIDWSWALLTADERAVLRRLAVFRDGFTLADAEAVVTGPGERVADVMGRLASLVDQSLVTVHEGERLRFRLLETVREFGRLRLAQAGEVETTDLRLRAWATGLAGVTGSRIHGPDQIEAMADLRAEEGNLLDVLGRALDATTAPDPALVVTLAAALFSLWTIQGDHLRVVAIAESVEAAVSSAELPPDSLDDLRTVLTALIVNTLIFSTNHSEAGLARLVELGPGTEPRLAALVRVSLVLSRVPGFGDPSAFEELCASPDVPTRRAALQWSAQLHENAGDLGAAIRGCEAALELCDDSEGPWGRALIRSQLAGLAAHIGDYEMAQRYAELALPDMTRLGAADDAAQLLGVIATAAITAGRLDEAEGLLAEIAETEAGRSLFGGALIAVCGRAELALARGETEAGLAAYRAAVSDLVARVVPELGLAVPDGLEPWVLFPAAGAVAAHARYGGRDEGAAMAGDLRAKALAALDAGNRIFLDYPVLGSVLVAVALWSLYDDGAPAPSHAVAVDLLAYGEAFGYGQMMPSLAWPLAAAVAETRAPGRLETVRATLAGRRGAELRDDVRRLLVGLD